MASTRRPRLVEAFSALTRTIPAGKNRFGSPSLRVEGVCDGTAGVQWNAWLEWEGDVQMAYAGVNLEGMAYDGWPVARFIERELAHPRLLEAREDVAVPHRVEVIWYRDAWQVQAHPPIREKLIGGSPRLLHGLSAAEWEAMLREAYGCLDGARDHRGRGRQVVTTSSGDQREFPVSPHFQLRQAFWPRDPSSVDGWKAGLNDTMTNLQPLHQCVSAQANMGAR